MTINTRDGSIAALAAAQPVKIWRNGARTTIAGATFSTIDLTGQPGNGTLGGTSTAAGVVPTDATAGCPTINAFGGGATGYEFTATVENTVASRVRIYDMLFKAGAYSFNSNVSLSAQPIYSARLPNTDYTVCELWIECVTAFTGNLTATITYTNEAGTTGRTATLATGTALTVGRMMRVSLQAGDKGIQKIESVVGSVATVGTFNVLVMREVWGMRVAANGADVAGPDRTGMAILFTDSALIMTVTPDSTAIGLPEAAITVGNG